MPFAEAYVWQIYKLLIPHFSEVPDAAYNAAAAQSMLVTLSAADISRLIGITTDGHAR